jgi:hypothetical protein
MNLLLEEEVGQEIDIDIETSEVIVRTYSRDVAGNMKIREKPWVPTREDLVPCPPVIP